MGKKSKPSETGMWFYHAPGKSEHQEQVGVPPASQIPLLNPDLPPCDDDRPKMWIRDSDSDYIKLAKMGGRQDLLSIKENRPTSKEAKAYPRVDWFYLEDNQMENVKENPKSQEDYEFMLPDYMVHPSSAAARGDRYQHTRAPYASDKTTVFERDGCQATDKTVKLPEARPAGYGYRQERHQGKPSAAPHTVTRPERMKGRSSELEDPRPKREPAPSLDEKAPVNMGKIMSQSYGKDWLSERDQWFDRQKKMVDRFEEVSSAHQHRGSGKSNTSGPQRGARPEYGQKVRVSKQPEKEVETELFKMSRFKKVPARTDSHRPKVSNSEPHMTEVV